MIERASAWLRVVGPVRMVFIVSLLLSALAVWNSPVLNRDGMFYVEWAQAIADHGLAGVIQYGDWHFLSFFPVLIAFLGKATGLGLEATAQFLDALLLAGTCSLLVAITRRRLPEAAWVACLVVLAMPAYNEYRNQVLREYGFWFFCMLGFWLAMRWSETNNWWDAVFCQAALAVATLFRLEAVAIYPALMLWQAFGAPAGYRIRRVLVIGSLPLAGTILAAVLFGSGLFTMPNRVAYYLDAANPLRALQIIHEAAGRMSESVFKYKYSREEAGYVLFFGLLAIIPLKFLKMSGVFLVPLAYAFAGRPVRTVLATWQPLPWVFLAFVLVLIAFVTHQFFLVGRYVGVLNLLAVPIVAAGLAAMMRRYPRWRGPMIALAVLTLLANVVSLSPKSTQIIDAGKWLSANRTEAARMYVENPRVAYYAGLGYVAAGRSRLARDDLTRAVAENRFDMLVLDASGKDGGIDEWLSANRLQVVRRFANEAGNAVIVAVPAGSQGSPSTAERSRANTGPTE